MSLTALWRVLPREKIKSLSAVARKAHSVFLSMMCKGSHGEACLGDKAGMSQVSSLHPKQRSPVRRTLALGATVGVSASRSWEEECCIKVPEQLQAELARGSQVD